jgi:thiol-disulfide isomerase/thioredoxin
MLHRRHFIGAFVTLALLPLATMAPAMEAKTFDLNAFAAAQAAGRPILLEIHASWCPTCRAQQPILSKLAANAKFKNIVRFTIDFDSRKDLLKQFKVRWQSTLIAFKGKNEVGRSTGDTNAASIEALVAKSI